MALDCSQQSSGDRVLVEEVSEGFMGEAALSLKDQGNEEFKLGNWLKAAAIYTKAIKQDPGNAVVYRQVFSSFSCIRHGHRSLPRLIDSSNEFLLAVTVAHRF